MDFRYIETGHKHLWHCVRQMAPKCFQERRCARKEPWAVPQNGTTAQFLAELCRLWVWCPLWDIPGLILCFLGTQMSPRPSQALPASLERPHWLFLASSQIFRSGKKSPSSSPSLSAPGPEI